jgi:hypothetical protein
VYMRSVTQPYRTYVCNTLLSVGENRIQKPN